MRNLTVYQRFAMIIAALTVVLFAVSALQILVLRDATLDERRTTVRNLVEAATKILTHYEGEAKAGQQMNRDGRMRPAEIRHHPAENAGPIERPPCEPPRLYS